MRAATQSDIFISYRRDRGYESAGFIAEHLKQMGFRVFIDLETLHSGDYLQQIQRQILGCQDFILILSEGALDRCIDEQDILRTEVLLAIEQRKNVIPVILRGFVPPTDWPAGLELLRDLQSVSMGSPEFFTASIKRIRSYLLARPGFSWRRHKAWILSAAALLVILSGAVVWNRHENHQDLVRECRQQVAFMGVELGKMETGLSLAEQAQLSWTRLQKELSAPGADRIFLLKQFSDAMDHAIQSLPASSAMPPLPESDLAHMARNGIPTQEILGAYTIVFPSQTSEFKDYFTSLKDLSAMPYRSEELDLQVSRNLRFLELGCQRIYYGFLELLAQMPPEVIDDDFNKIRAELTHLREIPVTLSAQEYEQRQEHANKEMEAMLVELGAGVKDDAMTVEMLQHRLDQLIASAQKGNPDSILAATKDVVDIKRAQVEQLEAEVSMRSGELRAA